MNRIFFQRTTRPRREPREHAVVSDLIRWYLHSPLLIPARPPRCSALRTASHSNKGHYTQALFDRRASRVETRNFGILGDWFLNSSRNDHQSELQVRGKQARYVLFFLAEIYYDEYVFHHSWRGTRLLAEGVYRGWWFSASRVGRIYVSLSDSTSNEESNF